MSASSSAPRRRWLGASCAAWAASLLTRAVLAQDASVASHAVPPECAGRAEWLVAVQHRLSPLLRTHPLLQGLSVRIEKLADRGDTMYAGELEGMADAGLGSSRRVRGATCEEVLDALSFIGALALERVATREGGDAPRSDADPPARGKFDAASSVGTDELGTPSDADRPQRVRLGVVGFALLHDQLTPGHSVDFGVAVRFAWSAPSWQPLFLLGAYSTLPEQVPMAGGGQTRFEHWSSHAVGCPWRFPQAGPLGLRPCLELDVGRSSGEGLRVSGATKRAAPWVSGGAQLRLELATWERLELGASIAGVVPFWRAHFLFTPGLMSFEAPSFGFRAGSYASLIF